MGFVPPSGGPAEELPPLSAFGAEWADLVIPDDAAELEAEANQIRAELASAGVPEDLQAWLRGRRLARFPRTYFDSRRRTLHPDRASTIFFGVCVVLVGLVLAALPLISGPASAVHHQPSAALATTTIVSGSPGGLMPEITVSVRGRSISLRDLRPAVLVFLPSAATECNCDDVIHNAVGSALSYSVPVYLVDPTPAATGATSQAEQLASRAGAGDSYAVALNDPGDSLAHFFRSAATTGELAVFVAKDGLILGPPLPLQSKSRIETWLDRLI